MSGLLASVRSTAEASLAAKHGADIIDLKDPGSGALGALPVNTVRSIVQVLDGVRPVSATIGDIAFRAELIRPAILSMAETGVDIVKIGVFGDLEQQEELNLLTSLGARGIRMVLVIFAEDLKADFDASCLQGSGIIGVMLDTRDKNSGGLLDKLDSERIKAWLENVRDAGLLAGLAGSLSAADVDTLLPLGADYLGFRGALCRADDRKTQLDATRLAGLRAQIPESKRIIIQSRAII